MDVKLIGRRKDRIAFVSGSLHACMMVESLLARPCSSTFSFNAFDSWKRAFNSAQLEKRRA